jgi:hypothetical protein
VDFSFLDSIKMPRALRAFLRNAGVLSSPGPRLSLSEKLTGRATLTKEHAKTVTVGRGRLRAGWVVVGILALALTGLLLFACVRALRSAVAGPPRGYHGLTHQ